MYFHLATRPKHALVCVHDSNVLLWWPKDYYTAYLPLYYYANTLFFSEALNAHSAHTRVCVENVIRCQDKNMGFVTQGKHISQLRENQLNER
jgi:hypothetical protein